MKRLISLFDDHKRIVTLLTGWESPRPVNSIPLIEFLARTLKDAYPNAEITCKCSGKASVSMVPTLEMAFFELVENAIEQNDVSTPSVRFVVKRGEPHVAIHVVDNGPTIPEMEYESLMDENRIRPMFHPTGLGL